MINIKWGILIAVIFIGSIIVCLSIGTTLLYGFLLTLLTTCFVLKKNGIPIRKTLGYAFDGIKSIKSIYVVIFLIGVNVAVWISSGIVPTMIYFGFSIINHINFIIFAFVATGIFALFIGTGLGTLSTIGVAIYSLGINAGMPRVFLLGAILSGAYIADRLSPISALVNFTLETVGISFKDYFFKTLKQMIPAIFTTGLIYYVMSAKIVSTLTQDAIASYKDILSGSFNISMYFFLVPLLVLVLSLNGVKSNLTLGAGVITSILISILVQGTSINELFGYMLRGYQTTSSEPIIQSLQIGGAIGMIEVVFIVMGGISMSTIFEKCGWIDPLVDFITNGSEKKHVLYLKTSLLSIGLDALTCDQTVGIIIPGKNLREAFEAHGLDRADLAALIANSGTAIAPLMPWNVNAIIILAITSVSAVEFAPFMLLNTLTLIIILLSVFLEEKYKKRKKVFI